MSKPDETLSLCEFDADPADTELIAEVLAATSLDFVLWRNRETGATSFKIYCPPEQKEQVGARVTHVLRELADILDGGTPILRQSSLPLEDWSQTWKKHFHAFRVSGRLVVKPSWEAYKAVSSDIVLEIDPGMTFGTGQHGTTRACLEFMDDLALKLGPVSLLDGGCGSGILSLAAVKLGYRPVYAFDHDPEAVRMTTDNLGYQGIKAALVGGANDAKGNNGVAVGRVKAWGNMHQGSVAATALGDVPSEVVVQCADLADYQPPCPCRVVVVNILAGVLTAHAERIVSFVDCSRGEGQLILSGILTRQYDAVRGRFEALGFRETERRTIMEWTSGLFALDRPSPVPIR